MKLCPFCASENIFFSKKRNKYFCEDCDNGFETPSVMQGMRIFLSYGHDKNADVVKKIKAYLTDKGYDVWIDSSEIPAGKNWRERITNGLLGSNGVISFLSKHSVRDPGVCLDELKIAVCLKHAYIKTVLLESESEVEPPSLVRDMQWLDLSDWERIPQSQWDDYFAQKMEQLVEMLSSDDAVEYNEELEFLSQQLNVTNNTAKEQRLLKQVFIGRDWLTEKTTDWLHSADREPFLICGVPGSGKSAFSANFARFNTDVLASIFLEWDHAEHHSADEVIKDLAFKLAAKISDYRRMLCKIYKNESERKTISQNHGATLFDSLIITPLQYCIGGGRKTGLIVIDGLDETAPEVAELLIQKSSHFPDWIKVLFTSRYDESLLSRMKQSNIVMLDRSHIQNTEDLCKYLAYRLELTAEDPVVCDLGQKCEGSFMYATTFCDAVDDGSMCIDDIHTVPFGLNNFYRVFFKRLFPTKESFREIRPFLELLCIDQDIPEEIITGCLKLDHYALMELRLLVKSLVSGAESNCGVGGTYTFKTLKFTHQSIKDWLSDPQCACEFAVDVSSGYRRLAGFREEDPFRDELKALQDSIDAADWSKKLTDIDVKNITEETVRQIQEESEAWRKAMQKPFERRANLQAMRSYTQDNYTKWLILGQEYGKAKELLLSSFDAEKMRQDYHPFRYRQYYKIFTLWRWADMFPLSYPVGDLVEKLREIVLFPRNYVVSFFAHRSFQISLLTLRYVMDTGRYAPAFYSLMRSLGFGGYFMSCASDDGETRDGWDKYYMARDAAICIRKLDKCGIPVPQDVRDACELMKLTYNYVHEDPNGGMFFDDSGKESGVWAYGILDETELFKDLCTLDVSQKNVDEKKLRLLQRYNTTSLRFYLANSHETDLAFIRRCLSLHADLAEASKLAIMDILNKCKPDAREEDLSGKDAERVAFIHALPAQI